MSVYIMLWCVRNRGGGADRLEWAELIGRVGGANKWKGGANGLTVRK